MNDLHITIANILLQSKSVVLVGLADSGKTTWVKNTLIPYLESIGKSVQYLKDGDKFPKKLKDIIICDEVETLFDKEYLQSKNRKNYYTDKYLTRVLEWHKKYSKLPAETLFIITRNEQNQIDNLLKNFKRADWDNREILTIQRST